MLVFARTQEETAALAAWAAERIPAVRGGDFGPCQAAGVLRNGALAASIVFHDWQDGARTLQGSIAAETPLWASRDVLRGVFRYVFTTAGAELFWAATPHTADRTIRFLKGIGMKQDGVLRHRFGRKQHAVVLSMTRPEWERSRWKEAP